MVQGIFAHVFFFLSVFLEFVSFICVFMFAGVEVVGSVALVALPLQCQSQGTLVLPNAYVSLFIS